MAKPLTAKDLLATEVPTVEFEFLGKKAYLREPNAEGSEFMRSLMKDRERDAELTVYDAICNFAVTLCNEKGDLLFDDPAEGVAALRRLKGQPFIAVLNEALPKLDDMVRSSD